jgi:leucyl-tRNA synthetase
VWNLVLEMQAAEAGAVDDDQVRALRRKVHQTIRQISEDLEQFEFNTVISALMELTNEILAARDSGMVGSDAVEEAVDTLLLLMAPSTPHIAEELWSRRGNEYSIHNQGWPEFDPDLAAEEQITLIVQVNGKLRDRIEVPAEISEQEAKELALGSEVAQRFMEGKEPRDVIYVPGRLVNIVV